MEYVFGKKEMDELNKTEWTKEKEYAYKEYKGIWVAMLQNKSHIMSWNQPRATFKFVKSQVERYM